MQNCWIKEQEGSKALTQNYRYLLFQLKNTKFCANLLKIMSFYADT